MKRLIVGLAVVLAQDEAAANDLKIDLKFIETSYVELTQPCKNSNPITGKLSVSSVAECESKCDSQAAAAPGTGQPACIGVDTDGGACYLKSSCDGNSGACRHEMCGYRRAGAPGPSPPSPPTPPVPPAPPGMTLRKAAAKAGIFIGAATNVAGVQNQSEAQYRPLEQSQFSLTTAENACKFGPIHPERDRYNWEGCDAIFSAAAAADQKVRGHNLCWHTENPEWLLRGGFNASELRQILRDHIHTVVTRYGTRALAWDVVNEGKTTATLEPDADL